MPAFGVKTSLLQTKLYPPPLTEDYVPRRLLHTRLEQITQRPLTLVSAPAGYGKSTLLSAWLEHIDCCGAWLTLDEYDNDLGSFEAYLLASIRTLLPSFGDELLAMLDGANLPSIRAYVQMLCAELDQLQSDIMLILDDYGMISNHEVHKLLTVLLQHPHPNFHLVLVTRHDPPLPLSDWRARNCMVEIRSPELRFSLAETASFLHLALAGQLNDELIAALNQKTEGWPAALRLAALSFSRIEEFQDQIDKLGGSNLYIAEYLVSQVLTRLPLETQSFLLQSSILNRFSAPLCQAVIHGENAHTVDQVILRDLEAANIFTIPLDNSGEWFRYHQLFQQFLQLRLAEEYAAADVAALHKRASTWFAKNGYMEEALQHALKTGNIETAVQLVAANRQKLMNQERYQRLSRWLNTFPQDVIDGSPDLLLLQARFAQIQRHDMAELGQIVDKVDALVRRLDLEPRQAHRYLAENEALRSAKHYFALDAERAWRSCQSALATLPTQWYALRSYCWLYGAVALQMMGDLSAAQEWIKDGRREDLTVTEGPEARNVAAEGFVCWMAADLTGLQHAGEFMLNVSAGSSRWQSQGWAHYFLACVHYQRHDLDSAMHHAQQTFAKRYVNHARANVFSAFIMALIEQVSGKPEKAGEMLALASDYAVEIRSPSFLLVVQAFQAELAVLQGRARELIPWAEQACAQIQLTAMPFFYNPQLTAPKVLLAAGTSRGHRQAAVCLQQLHNFAESTHNDRVLIEVLALEAILYAAQNDEEAAFAALERSLSLAQPGGFIRLYIDLGPKIANLLRSMQSRLIYAEYIASILKAYSDATPNDPQPETPWQLIDPLTDREVEILDLLAKRYTNKEIAAELIISPATVKRHTINIYQKLDVHKRREAVNVARALGLVPRP